MDEDTGKAATDQGALHARRVLVTGGSGFIGTNVVEALARDGAAVLNLDIAAPRNAAQHPLWRRVDVLDAHRLEDAVSTFQPDVVLHLAAQADLIEKKDLAHYAANIDGVANVVRAVAAAGCVRRAVFVSTRLVCDIDYVPSHDRDYHASTLYGVSKAHGEEIVRTASLDHVTWTILRPMGIWGPWFGSPYLDFFRMIGRGIYVHPGRRDVLKAYGYVENTVFQLQRIMDAPEEAVGGRTFWVADYEPVRVREWADMIQRALGARRIAGVPVGVLRAGGAIGDGLERLGMTHPPLTSFRVNNMVTDMLCDTGPLEALTGSLPYSLEEGVARTVAWMRGSGG